VEFNILRERNSQQDYFPVKNHHQPQKITLMSSLKEEALLSQDYSSSEQFRASE
jgi:hypothetical protein